MRFNNGGTRAYTYRVTVPPTVSPVTLATAKSYLKVTSTSDDALIQTLIDAATGFAEGFTRRDFITRTYETFRDFFPNWCDSEGYYACGNFPVFTSNTITSFTGHIGFELRRSPLQSVTSVQYLLDNVLTPVISTVFYNTLETDYSEVLTLNNQNWPENADVRLQAITITFITGFGDAAADMPAWVTEGILQHVANMYEDRGDCSECDCKNLLPTTARALYLQNRIINL